MSSFSIESLSCGQQQEGKEKSRDQTFVETGKQQQQKQQEQQQAAARRQRGRMMIRVPQRRGSVVRAGFQRSLLLPAGSGFSAASPRWS